MFKQRDIFYIHCYLIFSHFYAIQERYIQTNVRAMTLAESLQCFAATIVAKKDSN